MKNRNRTDHRRPVSSSHASLVSSSPIESLEGRRLLATLVVTSLADSGAGSLRQAIADANASDTIDLTGLSGTIALAGTLTINKSLTITGPGADELVIDGDDTFLLFEHFNGNVSVSGVTLQDGYSGNIGGAWATSGGNTTAVAFDGVTFASNGSNNVGGAIYVDNNTVLTINRSAFHDNSAGNVGGAVSFFGTVLTFTNNTVYNNTAGNIGTGLALSGSGSSFIRNSTFSGNGEYPILVSDGNATITNSTLTGNAGGILADFAADAVTLTNSIVWGNVSGNGVYDVLSNTNLTSGGNNLVGVESPPWNNTAVFTHGVNGDQTGVDPKLNTLADNGGPTQTLSLQADSPAINAGNDAAAPDDDQRGYGRTGTSDIGAFEFNGVAPTIPVNNAPVWTTTSLSSAALGVPFSMTIAFTDADVGDTLNVALSGFPDSFSFVDHGNGTATITGTAQMSDVGTHNVTLIAGDGTDTINNALSFYVGAPIALVQDRTLYVNGTNNGDDIQVWTRIDSEIRVRRNDKIKDYAVADIDRVKVIGYDDHDTIRVNVKSLSSAVTGDNGNDTLYGGPGEDRLYGGDGDDLIDAGAGRNWVWGGAGNDTLIGGNSTDRLYGGAGNDLLIGRGKVDFLDGGDDVDTVEDSTLLDNRVAIEILA